MSKHMLKCGLLNTRSICNKLKSFHKLLFFNNFDVFAITETWLGSHILDSELLADLPYTCYRNDRHDGRKAGGVLLAIKTNLISRRRVDLEDDLEMVVVEIECKDAPSVLVANFYRPPDCSLDFVKKFASFLDRSDIARSNKKLVILGDFNYPKINCIAPSFMSTTSDEFLFCEILHDYYLSQIVTTPTRLSNPGSTDGTVLDLIITNFPEHVLNLEVLSPNETQFRTDHSLLVFDITVKPQHSPKSSRLVYNYRNADFVGLKKMLRDTNFEVPDDNHADISLTWQRWCDLFSAVVDRHVPKRKVRSGTPPWIDGEVLHLLHQKNTARRRALSRGMDSNSPMWGKYRYLRRMVKSSMRKKHRIYIESLQATLKDNPKHFWSCLKSRTKTGSIPNIVKHNDMFYRNPKEKAQAFNDYFHTTFTSTNPADELLLPDVNVDSSASSPLDSITVTVEEVAAILHQLDSNKAYGPDGIPARLLKECADEVAPSLCSLFNLSLQSCCLPSQWKLAHVVPVHKKGSKEVISNYRPISLLCIVSKVLERCVFTRLISHMAPQLHDAQHGFLSGRSTVTQLLCFLHELGSTLDKGLQSDVVYLDFSKAFDSVNHVLLIHKLKSYGIGGSLLSWISDYLSSRTQCTVVDGHISGCCPVLSGVPQGSILGPLLFLVYVNDLPCVAAENSSFLYADDTKCYNTIREACDANSLQVNLDRLYDWSQLWKLRFNQLKCESLTISRKKTPVCVEYKVGSHPIKSTTSQKDLGVHVTTDLKWNLHTSAAVGKAYRMLGLLKRNTKGFSVEAKRLLYLTFVRPHIDYASEVWSGQSIGQTKNVEGVQRRATSYILGTPRLSVPYKERCLQTRLLPISYWHEIKDLLFLQGCVHGKYNIDLSRYLPTLPTNNLRSSCAFNLQIPKCRTKCFQIPLNMSICC